MTDSLAPFFYHCTHEFFQPWFLSIPSYLRQEFKDTIPSLNKCPFGFERELGDVYERVWRKEREERNDVIMLYFFQKKTNPAIQ